MNNRSLCTAQFDEKCKVFTAVITTDKTRRQFASKLLKWFKTNSRDFPWRHSDNPYHILMAEILLQRTKADQVKPVYERFIRSFPTPLALAEANTKDIEDIIESLGLRKKAGMIEHFAQDITKKHGGNIPREREDLLGLKGVGYYVANAVLCFAFGKDVPIVDWNVARVFKRFLGYPQKTAPHADKRFINFVSSFIPKGNARNFNFALLDFSATVCTPKKPACDSCPIQDLCSYHYLSEVTSK